MKIIIFLLTFLSISLNINAETLKSFELPIYNEQKKFKLSEHKDKIIVINFWASWCPACIQELDELNLLKDKNPNALFIAVNAGEEKNKIAKFLKKRTFNYLILEDSERVFSKSLKIDELPRTLVIDSQGNIVFNSKSPPKDLSPYLSPTK